MCVLTEGSMDEAFQSAASVARAPGERSSAPWDCVVSTYMLDLLSDDDCCTFFSRCADDLRAGGHVALVGLSAPPEGAGPLRRMAALVWAAAHAITPETVGGCRTQELIPYAEAARLQGVSRDVVCAGERLRDPLSLLCSEVLIARKPLE